MKFLFVLNDAPYGSEKAYNALRLAGALGRAEGAEVRVFLMGDGASCGKRNQKVPGGYYNADGLARSTLDELARWTLDADKVLVF